ncbi:MAG: hypothetical protein AB1757_17265 [Acidobacteriota bacterium]
MFTQWMSGSAPSSHPAFPLVKQDTAPVSPKVSDPFQAEIQRLFGEGLTLKEALEADLEPTGAHHLAAIFERGKHQDPKAAYEFRLIESDGKTAKTIFRRTEFFFSFAALNEMNRLNATDINGDGLKEIIVQSSSGGNCWACNPIEIYQVKAHKGVLIAAAPIQKIADLNGDKIYELMVADARWEFYGELSHAASPNVKLIYKWLNGRYVNASREFADFYQAEIVRLRQAIQEAKTSITDAEGSDDFYIGLILTLAITYRHAGDLRRGLDEMEAMLKTDTRTAEQLKRREAIIKDFRLGESAQKILQVKYGDPIL